ACPPGDDLRPRTRCRPARRAGEQPRRRGPGAPAFLPRSRPRPRRRRSLLRPRGNAARVRSGCRLPAGGRAAAEAVSGGGSEARRPFRLGADVRAYAAAGIGILRRDASIRLSYRGSLVSENVGIVFALAVFYFIAKLVRVAPFHSPAQYFAFAVVGIVIFGIV